MTPATLMALVPLALDGESVSGNSTSIAIVAAVSIASGYVLLAALWYFVFRDKAARRRERRPPR